MKQKTKQGWINFIIVICIILFGYVAITYAFWDKVLWAIGGAFFCGILMLTGVFMKRIYNSVSNDDINT